MSTTVDTLIESLRRRLSDYTDEAYDADMLLNSANTAARMFATTTGCNQRIGNVTSGTASSIALSNTSLINDGDGNAAYEVLNVYGVEYKSIALYWAPRHEAVKWSPSAGTPTGWSVWAGTIYLDMSITMSSTNDIDVSYTYAPVAVTSTESAIDIPDRWMPAIEAYMRFTIHEMNRDESLAANAYLEFEAIRNTAAAASEAQMSKGGYS